MMTTINRGPKVRAWAIITNGDKLALFDGRAPIYWLRQVAQQAAGEHGLDRRNIRRVTITIDPKDGE